MISLHWILVGTGIMIPASALFNKWIFEFSISITHRGKSFPHTHPIMGITHRYPRGQVKLTSLVWREMMWVGYRFRGNGIELKGCGLGARVLFPLFTFSKFSNKIADFWLKIFHLWYFETLNQKQNCLVPH